MTNLSDFEARVKSEYGILTAELALHPKTAVLIALVIGIILGRAHFPWLF